MQHPTHDTAVESLPSGENDKEPFYVGSCASVAADAFPFGVFSFPIHALIFACSGTTSRSALVAEAKPSSLSNHASCGLVHAAVIAQFYFVAPTSLYVEGSLDGNRSFVNTIFYADFKSEQNQVQINIRVLHALTPHRSLLFAECVDVLCSTTSVRHSCITIRL